MKLAQKKKQMHDFYENSARYYETMEDYSKAISYIDSAIVYENTFSYRSMNHPESFSQTLSSDSSVVHIIG